MTPQPKGYFSLVLHAHLPYVLAHGRWPHGTDWLSEAACETYLPLLNVFNDLVATGIPPKVTLNLSPVLCEQLASHAFVAELLTYLDQKIKAAKQDRPAFKQKGLIQLAATAAMWHDFYLGIKKDFEEKYNHDLIGAFRKLNDTGSIEVITCAATHGYLPLLAQDMSVQAQVKQAVVAHQRHFGKKPRGLWLPECAYRPGYAWAPPVESPLGCTAHPRKGVEEFLSENGIEFFFIDAALLKGGKAIGVYIDRFEALAQLWQQFEKEYRPAEENILRSPREVYLVGLPEKKPVAVFTRDAETALVVWSGEHGYPADGNYLDFHKKHFPGGLRYWKVTSAKSDLADKKEYEPEAVEARLEENANHFVSLVKREILAYYEQTKKPGLVVAPYDAELFGHWWFEGPRFLKKVLTKIAQDPEISLSTAGEYLDLAKPSTVISIPEGSWGEGGYHYIWLNQWTEWTWQKIYSAEAELSSLLGRAGSSLSQPPLAHVLKQAARELLLLQASDWQFLISTWAARDYAELRLAEHFEKFSRLADFAEKMLNGLALTAEEEAYRRDCETQDNLFPDLDLAWFQRVEFPAR